ncbi:NAD(P)-binding domain-containing protein, partial [Streptomyces griseoincarnatus]
MPADSAAPPRRNLARNFARNGYTVAVHNRTASRTHALVEEFG